MTDTVRVSERTYLGHRLNRHLFERDGEGLLRTLVEYIEVEKITVSEDTLQLLVQALRSGADNVVSLSHRHS